MTTDNPTLDVLVIGAGQAGLALGYHLKQTPLRFQLIESNAHAGDSWRKRYDSLVLFTPRRYSALPGLTLAGDPWGYANKDEFADYLDRYAAHFALPVRTNTLIQRLERCNGHFRAITHQGDSIEAQAITLATGAFQQPAIPAIAEAFSPEVQQLSAANYQNPTQLPAGTVLVVGDGATGRDLAGELCATHRVLLATGRPRRLLPERILGASTWWWLDKLGILRLSGETALGRFIRQRDPFPGRGKDFPYLQSKGVQVVGRLTAVDGKKATFADGTTTEVDAVVWTTGYKDQTDWVAIPEVKDAQGGFVQHQGISAVPGLYFIGRPWQRNRGSALITGVGADAHQVVQAINRSLNPPRRAPTN